MRAYGSQGHWDLDDYAPPTRIANKRSKTRRIMRRKLHQKAKTDLRKEFYREINSPASGEDKSL
jgi:hypothetical protein